MRENATSIRKRSRKRRW